MSGIRTLALHSDDGNRIRLYARLFLAFGLALLLALAPASLASAQGATVQVSDHPTMGKILTDAKGMTLYLYTKDQKNVSNCYGQCAANWPPLLASGSATPAAGTGLSGTLGTIDRTDGSKQVTYNGIPLYYFVKDTKAGDANGQNVGNVWFVVHPDISSMTVASPQVMVSSNKDMGDILTSQAMTLYLYTKDSKGVSNCYDQCAANWPPLLANGGQPAAGPGLTGQLGTIDRKDGTKQVTYNGIPLYFFIKDTNPGDVNGQGVGTVWYILHADTNTIGPVAASPQVTATATVAATAVVTSTAVAAPAATGTPSTLPVTGGGGLPGLALLVLAAGGLLLVGGLGLALARRPR